MPDLFLNTAVFLEGFLLLLAIHAETVSQLLEINLMPIEFRTVHAGELHLSTDGHPTAATHARTVYHNRIQTDDGGNAP